MRAFLSLRQRNFRLYWSGQLISLLGTWMQSIGQAWLVLELTKTPDILRTLGGLKKPGQTLVGFALETTNGRSYALDKLRSKNADWIVLNTLTDNGAGFGVDTNKITIFGKDGSEQAFEKKPKQQVAKDIVDTIVKRL